MNTVKVSSVQTTVIHLEVNGRVLVLSKEEAIHLAVQLAFLADGNMTTGTSNCDPRDITVTGWNTDSPFFRAYAKQVTG